MTSYNFLNTVVHVHAQGVSPPKSQIYLVLGEACAGKYFGRYFDVLGDFVVTTGQFAFTFQKEATPRQVGAFLADFERVARLDRPKLSISCNIRWCGGGETGNIQHHALEENHANPLDLLAAVSECKRMHAQRGRDTPTWRPDPRHVMRPIRPSAVGPSQRMA